MLKNSRNKRKYVVLAVRVAKPMEERSSPGPIAAEQLFAVLHGISSKFSFEITNVDGRILFCFWCPRHFKELIENQIYAHYSDAEIEEIEDYSKLQFGAIGAYLKFQKPDIYPIKRYPQFEDRLRQCAVDPLGGITAALVNLLKDDDRAVMQVIFRPISGNKLRIRYINVLRILNKGLFSKIERLQRIYTRIFITRKKWLRVFFSPVFFIFWLQGIYSGVRAVRVRDELSEELSKTHDRETDTAAAMDKVGKQLFEVTIRIGYLRGAVAHAPANIVPTAAVFKIKEMAGSFKQFDIPQINGFLLGKLEKGLRFLEKLRHRSLEKTMIMNSEELATICHFPGALVHTPKIEWVRSRKIEPPREALLQNSSLPLGISNYRSTIQEIGIKAQDRRRHIYIIGKTGMGKSTLLENMLFRDIQNGNGVGLIDPHGDLANRIIDFVPSNRTNDVVVFDPADRDFPIAFNMLENIDSAASSIVASGLVGVFKKLYSTSWGPRLEHILRNTILALLEYPNTTMLSITRMLQDKIFRTRVVNKITDPVVKRFWRDEFEPMEHRQKMEAISPILNKVGQFLSSPIIRNIVGQPKSSIDLRFAMDKGKIIIVNLSKGKIGEDNAALLGSMMITKFQLDAMSRATIAEKDRKDFYLYVDEFQNFATEAFATILSEARKYRLNLTMANQYIAQMPDEVRNAVFGNVGTLVSFQVGFDDAAVLRGQFGEKVLENDVVSLGVGETYLRLLVDGMPTQPFSMATFPSLSIFAVPEQRWKIIKVSRDRYSKPREIVEDKIRRWSDG